MQGFVNTYIYCICNHVTELSVLLHFFSNPSKIVLTAHYHFRDILVDSQTTDIAHFGVVLHYDVTMKALEILRSRDIYLWRHNEKQRQSAWCP